MFKIIILALVILSVPSGCAEAIRPAKHNFVVKVKSLYQQRTGDRLEVTSFVRTSAEQAAILINFHKKGHDLYRIYRDHKMLDDIYLLIETQNYRALVWKLEYYLKHGRVFSKHMCGMAVDVVGKDRAEIKKIARQLDLKVLTYRFSQHIHLALKGDC